MNSLFKITSSLSFALMLSACGGGGNGGDPGDPPNPTDTEAPSLSITSPTSAARHDSDSASITLGGEASDNEGVVAITWQCTGGCSGSGSASGTANWSTGSIDLAGGDNNTIVVTARDAAGNTGSDSIVVSYAANQPVSSITDTDAAPNSVDETAPAGTAVGITAHATDGDEGDAVSYQLTADSSGLFRIDQETGVVSLAKTGLDYETSPSHTITVVAHSSDETSSSANFTIDVIDITTPVLSIAFPPEGALFNGDAIMVKGTFAEAHSIQVSNGAGDVIAAQLDDTAGTWTARLPLAEAAGNRATFSVSAKGDEDEAVTATRTVRTDTLIGDMGVVVFDEDRNQLIVADNQYARLVRVNTEDWSQSVLSGKGVGDGEDLVSIAGMVMDSAGKRVILTDSERDLVVAVDVDTGNRKVISGAGVGTGTDLWNPAGLAMRGGNILLLDGELGTVVEIDAATGNRTILSGPDNGSGEPLRNPTAIVLTNPGDLSTAHVIDPLVDRLFAIDLETGDRTVYENTGTPDANHFGDATQVALVNGRILVIDKAGNSVSSVNPLDGTRSTFSRPSDDIGTDFHQLSGIAFGLGNNGDPRLVAADAGLDKVFLLGGQGTRRLMPINAIGEGPLLQDELMRIENNWAQVEFDPVEAQLYYWKPDPLGIDQAIAVLSIDAESGNRQWFDPLFLPTTDLAVDEASGRMFFTDGTGVRELVSRDEFPYRSSSKTDPTVGDGIAFQSAEWIFYDPGSNESYIADTDSNALIRVDMATGNRFAVSDEDENSSFRLTNLQGGLVVDVAGGRAVAITLGNDLFAIDLTTGVRSSFASEGRESHSDIALDRSHRRVIAATPYTGSLAAIDLATQNRTILSSADIGNGPAFEHPYRLSLDEKNQVAYVVDRDLAAVFAVDLQTGDRVVMSK